MRHRLFEQHVVAEPHGLNTRFVMQIIGHRNDHHVGELGPFQDMLPGDEAVFVRDVMRFGVTVIAFHDGFRNSDNIEFLRILGRVLAIQRAATSCTEGDGRQRAVEFVGRFFASGSQYPAVGCGDYGDTTGSDAKADQGFPT
jgi:hypothetical protein